MIADSGEFFNVESCIDKGILGRVIVFLDGAQVNQAIECVTGNKGYVVAYDDPPKVDKKNECLFEHKYFGDVRVEIADE